MNNWIIQTPRGKKTININPEIHSVIAGELWDRAMTKRIGRVVRLAPMNPVTGQPVNLNIAI